MMALPADVATRHCLLPADINQSPHRTQCACINGCYDRQADIEHGCVLPAAYIWTGSGPGAIPTRLCEPCCAEWRRRTVPARIIAYSPQGWDG